MFNLYTTSGVALKFKSKENHAVSLKYRFNKSITKDVMISFVVDFVKFVSSNVGFYMILVT